MDNKNYELLSFINENPTKNDRFEKKKIYRVKTKYNKYKTYIELELYKHNICVLSFYVKNKGEGANRYKKRANLGAGHALCILNACMDSFYLLKQDYSLIFAASNDIDKKEEMNKRYSVYTRFLERYYGDSVREYIFNSSIALNTLMVYHQSFQYKKEADSFFKEYEQKVAENL